MRLEHNSWECNQICVNFKLTFHYAVSYAYKPRRIQSMKPIVVMLARGRCLGTGPEVSKNLEAITSTFIILKAATLSTIMPVQTHDRILLVVDALQS